MSFPNSPTVDMPSGAAAVQISLWQHPFVQNTLPLLTSLMMHLAIVAVGIVTYKVVVNVAAETHEQSYIPTGVFVDASQQGGVPHPGITNDGTRDAAQNKFDVQVSEAGFSDRPSRDLTLTLSGGGSSDALSDSAIGLGPRSNFGKGPMDSGPGDGSTSGPGTGNGGALAVFGMPGGGGGGIGPRTTFCNFPGGGARRVVFICDATGSMMPQFDNLRIELRKSVEALRPPQSFNVVFMQEDAKPPLDKSLLFASPDNKRRMYDYVDQYAPRGGTDPMPALKLAFAMKPDLIFFLCDPTDFPDPKGAIDFCRRSNPSKSVRINTISFNCEDANGRALLHTIATDSGGFFNAITDKDLVQ